MTYSGPWFKFIDSERKLLARSITVPENDLKRKEWAERNRLDPLDPMPQLERRLSTNISFAANAHLADHAAGKPNIQDDIKRIKRIVKTSRRLKEDLSAEYVGGTTFEFLFMLLGVRGNQGELIDTLNDIDDRAAEALEWVESLKGSDYFENRHNPEFYYLVHTIIRIWENVTGEFAGSGATGPAQRFLVAVLNPVIRFSMDHKMDLRRGGEIDEEDAGHLISEVRASIARFHPPHRQPLVRK